MLARGTQLLRACHLMPCQVRDEFRYALLRDRFISPSAKVLGKAPPLDFDFSSYLRRRCSHLVAHSLHVGKETWLVRRQCTTASRHCGAIALFCRVAGRRGCDPCSHLQSVLRTMSVSSSSQVVILYLALVLEVPPLEGLFNITVGVNHIIGLGWSLWLACFLFQVSLCTPPKTRKMSTTTRR